MTNPDLPEVGARLKKAVEYLATVRQEDDRMQSYEDAAVAVVDSEHAYFADGALEAYLTQYLQRINQ